MAHFKRLIHQQKQVNTLPLSGAIAHEQLMPSQRSLELPRNETKKAGVMCLLYERSEETHFALIERASHPLDKHKGQISFPGGKEEDFDVDMNATALRETEEEIGILKHDVKVIKQLSRLYIPVSDFLVFPYLGVTQSPVTFLPDEREVANVLEVPLSKLLAYDTPDSFKYKSSEEDEGRDVPCFYLADKCVWGATAMILNEVKVLLKGLDW